MLYAAAACFLLTACLEGFIRLPPVQAGRMQSMAMLRADLRAGLRFLCREQPDVFEMAAAGRADEPVHRGHGGRGLSLSGAQVLGLSAELYGAAESAMGVAAVLGSLFAGLTAGRLRLCLAWVFLGVGAALALAGGAFLVPLGAMAATSP